MDGRAVIGDKNKQMAALEEEGLDGEVSKAVSRQNVHIKMHMHALQVLLALTLATKQSEWTYSTFESTVKSGETY